MTSRPSIIGLTAATLILLGAAGCGRSPHRPNIVLIVLDTVRRDATGIAPRDDAWIGLTPNLDQLGAEGTIFPHAWATAPWTVPSHASIFTGLLPLTHGCITRHPRLGKVGPTLAELLRDAGYETAAFFSNPWLAPRTTDLLRGFETQAESPIGGLTKLTSAQGDQGGAQTVHNLREWSDHRDGGKPFFVFVNFLESHLPYDPPAGYRDRHLADLPRDRKISIQWAYEYNAGLHPDSTVNWPEVRELYGGDVHTADAFLGEVVDLLREKGLYEHSVIIVTSDHGENIGDHRLMDHQFSVHQTLLAVPLVIRAPDVWPGAGVRNDSVLLTDLYPTILELAGVSADTIRVQGRSLLHADPSGGKARPLFADYSEPSRVLLDLLHKLNPNADLSRLAPAWRTVRVGRFRLTVGSDGTVLLHDVVADPGQKHNLAPEQPETVALLERVLTQSQVATRSEAGGEFEIDAQTREQLRSLGYIQ